MIFVDLINFAVFKIRRWSQIIQGAHYNLVSRVKKNSRDLSPEWSDVTEKEERRDITEGTVRESSSLRMVLRCRGTSTWNRELWVALSWQQTRNQGIQSYCKKLNFVNDPNELRVNSSPELPEWNSALLTPCFWSCETCSRRINWTTLCLDFWPKEAVKW